jgi:hypothetical protein
LLDGGLRERDAVDKDETSIAIVSHRLNDPDTRLPTTRQELV